MNRKEPMVRVKIWGDLALFSRADTPSEQVSYPCITPSAGRGILEAIFWKPEFTWLIRRIHILKPINFLSLTRNEGGSVIPSQFSQEGPPPYYIDEDRQQRHALFLQDVAYILEADIVLREHTRDPVIKYIEMFQRRLKQGRCYHRPYLGTRECSAFFAEPTEQDAALPFDFPIGTMLLDFKHPANPKDPLPIPHYFSAMIRQGILDVPYKKLAEVNRVPC